MPKKSNTGGTVAIFVFVVIAVIAICTFLGNIPLPATNPADVISGPGAMELHQACMTYLALGQTEGRINFIRDLANVVREHPHTKASQTAQEIGKHIALFPEDPYFAEVRNVLKKIKTN